MAFWAAWNPSLNPTYATFSNPGNETASTSINGLNKFMSWENWLEKIIFRIPTKFEQNLKNLYLKKDSNVSLKTKVNCTGLHCVHITCSANHRNDRWYEWSSLKLWRKKVPLLRSTIERQVKKVGKND